MENKGNFSWGMFKMKMKNVTVFVIFLFALLWINFLYVCCYLNISFYIYGFFLTNTNQYVIYTLYKFVKSKIHSQSNSSILLTFAFNIFYYLLNWKYTQFSVDLGERERRTIIQVWYKCSNVLLSHFISFWYWYIISKFGLVFRCVIFTAQ